MFKLKPYLGPDRRIAKPSPLFIGLSLLGVAGIVFATLCPLEWRPRLASPEVERFGAYFVLGLIVAMTLRRHFLMVVAAVVILAFALEAGQLLAPGRDARFADAAVKALGGLAGSGVGYSLFPIRRLVVWLMRTAADRLAPTRNLPTP